MNAHRILVYIFWVVPAALQAGIASKMYLGKLVREFPFFFAYTIVSVVKTAVLFSTYHLSRPPFVAYFFEYWIGEALDIALGISVIYELYSHLFRPYSAIQRLGKVLFQWCGAVLALVAVVMAATSTGSDTDRLIAGILAAEQCFSIVRAGLLLFLFLFARAFGLTWRHYVFGIALGFAVYVSVELGTAAIRAHTGASATAFYSLLKPAAYNCCTLIWVLYFLRQQPVQGKVQFLPTTELEQWNSALLNILQR